MRFSFLHAADLHLGSPLAGLAAKDEDIAKRFSRAGREAFSALVSAALEHNVAFMLIAGDIYDGAWKDASVGLFFAREMARLARANIPVLLTTGNHDADNEFAKTIALPENVVKFSSKRAHTHILETLGAAVHGRSFGARATSENYAISYPAPIPGLLNIGLLHTSLEGDSAHATYAPCTLNDLIARGYDYWALGHIHQRAVLCEDPYIVYPGNLQGRSVRECGPKGATLVHVADGRIAGLEPLWLDQARWLHVQASVGGLEQEADILRAVETALDAALSQAQGRLCALRVTLTGDCALHGALLARADDLRDDIQAHADRRFENVWLESLKIATHAPLAAPARGPLQGAHLIGALPIDADVRKQAECLLDAIRRKLPAALVDEAFGDIEALLEDARALAVARAGAGN